ncbi:MAG: ATP-binding protein, partial [Lachnospiraceae bacterium]|nr:ATP-binding protein [Lachnospiraceae bacterium]
VDDSHIIELALDDDENIRWRNPIELGKHIRELMTDKERMYYIFLDEIQKVAEIPNPYLPRTDETVGFVDVVLGLMKIKNADVYVTGSNSKMLSSDILTEFRGRGDEIRVNPLSFSEFYNAYTGDKHDAWQEYFTYGGMPLVMLQKTHEDKAAYLRDLFDKIYLDDIIARNSIGHAKSVLEDLLDVISSSVGSLTNPLKLSNTFASVKKMSITDDTIAKYLDYFIDAFLLYKAQRFDVKGRKYIGSPLKYYFSDIGLRNARLNFRQQEENHIMENIIYNELRYRDYSVDVGIVEYNYKNAERKSVRSQLEIDFVASNGSDKLYIQSALSVSDEEKRMQEVNSLKRVNDSFRKIVVIKDNIIPWYDDDGIYYIGIEKFLLGEGTDL